MEYTEKEKKTIENIKDEFHINGLGARYTELKSEDLEILLSLLEKQRKEIEKLKEHLNQYYDGKLFTANQLKATEKEQNKYFIHKDKIREKIKELNDNRPYLSKFDDWKEKEYTNEDVTNKCVEILDDLLGE